MSDVAPSCNDVGPLSLPEALQILAGDRFPLLAGGTDFYPALQDQSAPAEVLDITRITELKHIDHCASGGWFVGAGATWSEFIATDLPPVFNALKAAAREVGAVQIQNAATLVGNVCNASPAADGVPPLLALDAHVRLQSFDGSRELMLSDFITGVRQTDRRPGELVTGLWIPPIASSAVSSFYKLGSRAYQVISIVMIAITLVPDSAGRVAEARIAVGACSPVAQRLTALENALLGMSIQTGKLSVAVLPEHLNCLSPIDDVRASACYRITVVLELLGRLLDEFSVR